ncbi:MAG: hypothetical protein EOO77_07355, partial [Oxalobacteraceae bacterium]
MRRIRYRQFIALLVLAFGTRQSAGAVPTLAEACPGAAAWTFDHPLVSQRASAPEARDAGLLADLQARVEKDQSARRRWLSDPKNEELARAVESIDGENLVWLKQLVSERGFPTASQVGNEGVHLAWILLQHADRDPEFQSRLLPILESRYLAGELPANDFARMTDRILIAHGKSQKYGTQFDWFSGNFQLPEPSKLAEIDSDRSRVG